MAVKLKRDGTPDKRCGKKENKGWCGTRKPERAKIATLKIKLADFLDNPEEDLPLYAQFFNTKEQHLHTLTQDENVRSTALELALHCSNGSYYDALGEAINKPYLNYQLKCNNSWYWHSDAAEILRTANSVNKRRQVEQACQKYDWNENKAADIQTYIHDTYNRWCSQTHIKNVCASRTISTFPEKPALIIDYSTQVSYTIDGPFWDKNNPEKEREVKYVLKFGDDKKRYEASASFLIPERVILSPMQLFDGCIRKPKIYRDAEYCKHSIQAAERAGRNTAGLDLVVDIPYWYYPTEKDWGPGVLGVDIGILRIFRAGVLYHSGDFIENIDPDREIERLNAHVQLLVKQKGELYEKIQHNEKLLAGADPDHPGTVALERKLAGQREQYLGVRSNIASERDSLEWLVANNVVRLAWEFACGVIRHENLSWVGGTGQSWDYSAVFRKLGVVADRYGIVVERVSAFKTSQLDPSTGEELEERVVDERVVVWGDGSAHDRDGSAGLVIAGRSSGYGVGQEVLAGQCLVEPFGKPLEGDHFIVRGGVRAGKRCAKVRGRRRERSRVVQRVECVVGYRSDVSAFGASIGERRREWREFLDARRGELGGGGSVSIFSFLESSRSVARLLCCRDRALLVTRYPQLARPTQKQGKKRSKVSKIPKQR